MRGTYIGDQKMLVQPVWGGSLIIPANDLSLMPELVIHGGFEMPFTKYLLKTIKPGNRVFDVGTHLGYFTVLLGYLVGPKGKVYAYEANPRMFAFLLDNLAINFHHDRTVVWNKAVYSRQETLTFHSSVRFTGLSSIYERDPGYYVHNVDHVETINVDAEPLDVHAGTVGQIDLLKIDIEGGEYHAFLGMRELLQRNAVRTVAFEWNQVMLKEDAVPFLQLLRDYQKVYGLIFQTLTPEGDPVTITLEQLEAQEFNAAVLMKRDDFVLRDL